MLGAIRSMPILLIVAIALAAPAASAETYTFMSPVQGPEDPQCAAIGIGNYDSGMPNVHHSIIGGGVWLILQVTTPASPGSEIIVAVSPISCATGMSEEEFDRTVPREAGAPDETLSPIILA